MKCTVLHRLPGRLRVHAHVSGMSMRNADVLEYYLRAVPGVLDVTVYDRTCDAVILYSGDENEVIGALSRFSFTDSAAVTLVPEHTGRALSREFQDKLFFTVIWRAVKIAVLPSPVRAVLAVAAAVKYVKKGLECLARGKIQVPVLDATAIAVSVLRGDFKTASSIMFLLKIGDILDDWTHRKSVDDLARTMSLNVDKVWLCRKDGTDISVPVSSVSTGQKIRVRTGGMIPLDGRVADGEMTVNQASMTGESAAVLKRPGSIVYAGTVVEEGECVICVEKNAGHGRYDRIVKMIEESERLKSETEDKASHLADKLVPYSLGATALTYLITGNTLKALSILMVDFSCALKLSMPIAVLSAMKEGSGRHISFKGGKFLEAVAEADTIVFDKTGTLTHATPQVAGIEAFGGRDEEDLLRIAACLEEHYPHSMANAVVKEASRRSIGHEECHSSIEYVVAHGIIGIVDGERVVIGSRHFVFEDEKCTVADGDKARFEALSDEYSHLFMAISGELAAVICIHDPLRKEAPEVIEKLRQCGFKHIVMMTGDSRKTAGAVARRLGLDEYYAEVLPEDKAEFVRRAHSEGRRVIMIGDGVNDAPALSEADAGVAVNTGAAIAREIADVTVTAGDLNSLVTMRRLSCELMRRINSNYRFIISFNMGLIILGVAGFLPPATSALLHNISTLAISLKSMTPLLDDK